MFHLRTTKTASGAVAIQVVRYQDRKTIVVSHIGSAHKPKEIDILKQAALQWIEKTSKQLSLLPQERNESSKVLVLDKEFHFSARF